MSLTDTIEKERTESSLRIQSERSKVKDFELKQIQQSEQITHLSESNKDLEATVSSLRAELSNLFTTNEKTQQDVQALEQQIQLLAMEKQQAMDALELKSSEVERLNNSVKSLDKGSQILQKQVRNLPNILILLFRLQVFNKQ